MFYTQFVSALRVDIYIYIYLQYIYNISTEKNKAIRKTWGPHQKKREKNKNYDIYMWNVAGGHLLINI